MTVTVVGGCIGSLDNTHSARIDMQLATRGWHRCAMIYRALVVTQTLSWAVSSLARVITRQARLSLDASPIAIAFAASAAVGIVAGIVTYYLRRTETYDRAAVVLAWACLQAAGFLALTGYATTGTAICFVVGMVTLLVMHVFSPNRFQS